MTRFLGYGRQTIEDSDIHPVGQADQHVGAEKEGKAGQPDNAGETEARGLRFQIEAADAEEQQDARDGGVREKAE